MSGRFENRKHAQSSGGVRSSPLGTAEFVTDLEPRLGRPIARRVPGRKAVAMPPGER